MDRREATRNILLSAAALAASPALAAAPAGQKIVHHVFFWLKNPTSADDRDQLIAGLRPLRAIGTARSVEIGQRLPAGGEGDFDVALLVTLNDAAALKAYLDDPIHRGFVASCRHLWSKVVAYDMATV